MTLEDYANEIPQEVKLLLKGLSNDDRLGILVSLLKNGKMTFNELKEQMQLSSSSLSNHLTALQDGNLIENFYEKSNEKGFSYYDVTDIPEAVLDALFDILYAPTSTGDNISLEVERETSEEQPKGTGTTTAGLERMISKEIRSRKIRYRASRLSTTDSTAVKSEQDEPHISYQHIAENDALTGTV